jgi:hypothetical protein
VINFMLPSLYPWRKKFLSFERWRGYGRGTTGLDVSGEGKNLLPLPGIEPRIVHYTDYAVPALTKI